MKTLSREHQAVFNFRSSTIQLRPMFERDQSQELTDLFDTFAGSVSEFMLTELKIRQGERCQALKMYPDYERYNFSIGKKLNNQGIDALKSCQEILALYKRKQKDLPKIDEHFINFLKDVKSGLNDQLLDVELKASDIKEIEETLDDVIKQFKVGKDGSDLLKFIGKNLDKLIKLRQSPDRGAEKNIAIWKLIAAAVILGMALWIVYKCYYSKWRCSSSELAIYNTILIFAIGALALGACE